MLFHSSSRGEVELNKSLTLIDSGFYSLTVSTAEASLLIDESYSYYIYQKSKLLKQGFVRLYEGEVNSTFDYILDFIFS